MLRSSASSKEHDFWLYYPLAEGEQKLSAVVIPYIEGQVLNIKEGISTYWSRVCMCAAQAIWWYLCLPCTWMLLQLGLLYSRSLRPRVVPLFRIFLAYQIRTQAMLQILSFIATR